MVVVTVFACLILLASVARLQIWSNGFDPKIESTLTTWAEINPTLFVFVHGLERGRFWPSHSDCQ